jgi:hypothetical protein
MELYCVKCIFFYLDVKLRLNFGGVAADGYRLLYNMSLQSKFHANYSTLRISSSLKNISLTLDYQGSFYILIA